MKRKIIFLAICAMTVFTFHVASAQQPIFLVRHGDTVRQKGNPDVPLSEPGERRASALAALLNDSGINTIYTTGLQRTVKTAEPLAKLLGIEPKFQPRLRPGAKPEDVENFVNLLRAEHSRDIVLAVLHSNSVPALLKTLGHSANIKIPETEFDNLFVIMPRDGAVPAVLRLRY